MTEKIHHPLIRTIYLYLFTLLGLTLLTIGSVRFVDMGLKAVVFTEAEKEQQYYDSPPYPPTRFAKMPETAGQKVGPIKENETATLSKEEKELFNGWVAEYNSWLDRKAKINYLTSRRHRDASTNLALILIGLPLYLFHWRIIKRETK